MKHWTKRLLVTTFAVGLLQTATAFAANINMDLFYNGKHHAYNAKEISIMIDGQKFVDPNLPAVSIDGRTMLPMRGICQELGGQVTWNESARQVYVVTDTHTVVFEIGKTTGDTNGKAFTMDVAPMIINDRTVLPVRALTQALDVNLKWDDPTRTIHIGEVAENNNGNQSNENQETENQETQPNNPPQTQIATLNNIKTPTSKLDTQEFVIHATSSFTKYQQVILEDNKIVLDVYGAANGLAENITNTNSPFVTAIRTGQHKADDGTTYTRIVFDLAGKKEYTIQENNDKTQIAIKFTQVKVKDVTAVNNGNVDSVIIRTDGKSGAKVTTSQNPNTAMVDMPMVLAEGIQEQINVNGLQYVKSIKTSWIDGTTFRVSVEAEGTATITWKEENDKLTIYVEKSTLNHVYYDNNSNVLRLEKVRDIDTNRIQHHDAYLEKYYELVLPGDYRDVYGYGTLNVGTDKVNSIQISQKGNQTVIRFNQNMINAYTIRDAGAFYEITAKNPKEVYKRVLLLDAGHGAKDPGTSGNGLIEKNLTLTMALKVEQYLKANSDIKVYMTRNSDTYPENRDRAKTANEIADFMVSIHMNAASPSANGTETLYTPHSNETSAKLTSIQAAQVLQSHVQAAVGSSDRGIKNRPDLLILNSTKVPAVLIEVCFLTNAGDALKISNPAIQDQIAKAIGDGIIQVMNNYTLR